MEQASTNLSNSKDLGSAAASDHEKLEFPIHDADRIRVRDAHYTLYRCFERGYVFRTHSRPFEKRYFTHGENP